MSGHPSDEFEALLPSVLDVAYRLAYLLAGSRAAAAVQVEEAVARACRQRRQRGLGAGIHFKSWFLGLMAERFYSFEHANPAPILVEGSEHEIHRALGSLPLGDRVVNALQLAGDLRYQDIATILDLPVSTVRTRLHRGRAILRRVLWQTAADGGVIPVQH